MGAGAALGLWGSGEGSARVVGCKGFPPAPPVHVNVWRSLGGENGNYLA